MGKADQGFRDLLVEVGQLVGEAVGKRMESEEFHESLDEINRRMSDRYNRVIGAIGVLLSFNFVTISASGGEAGGEAGGEEKRGKERLSLNFRFGSSKLDQKMGEELGLGLDEQEMNRLLEQARRERDSGERKDNAAPADAENFPEEAARTEETEEAAESPDPRSISQIINSIREIARSLNLEQRRLLTQKIEEDIWFLQLGIVIDAQIQNDTLWLQSIQGIINVLEGEAKRCGKSRGELRKIFLLVERLLKEAGEY